MRDPLTPAAPAAIPAGVRAATALFGVASVLAPLALGATPSLARAALEATVTLAVVVWAAWGKPARPGLALAPLAAVAALGLQLVPMPASLLAVASPLSADLWRQAGAGATSAWHPTSVDPAATAAGLRRLLLGLAMVVVVRDLGRWAVARRRLAACAALSGIVILALGLAVRPGVKDRLILGFVDLSGPIMFWKTPVHEPVETAGCSEPEWVTVAGERYAADAWIVGDRIGSYVVSNHFAGGLELTLPFAVALLVAARRVPRPAAVALAAGLAAAGLYAVSEVAGSRAGSAALALGLAVLVAGLAPRGWWRRAASAVAASLAVALAGFQVLFMTRSDWVVTWLPAAWRQPAWALFHDYRLFLGETAFRLVRRAPLAGTGLGSFGDTVQRVMEVKVGAFYAHNDWAQWIAETGLLGAAVAGVLVWVFLRGRRRRDGAVASATPAIDAAAWSAIAAIAAHSFHDWNLHVPANACLAAVAAGLALSGAGIDERDAEAPAAGPGGPAPGERAGASRVGRAAPAILAAACLLAMALLSRDAWADGERRRLRDALAHARLAAADPLRGPAEPALRTALGRGSAARRLDPSDSRFEVLLGQIGLHLAAVMEDPAAARDERAAAGEHLIRARRLSAVCRGMPETAPPPIPRRRRAP